MNGRGEDIMPKMVEYLKADKGTDEESKAKSELENALKAFDAALADNVPPFSLPASRSAGVFRQDPWKCPPIAPSGAHQFAFAS
jgi:hypothetical protein